MMSRIILLLIAAISMSACMGKPPSIVADPPIYLPGSVEFSLLSDDRGLLAQYPVDNNRAYVEAGRGERYRIRVANRSDRRVGLVIAVDGRNIISGHQSWLRNDERMYILAPGEEAEYTGWRTGQDRVNRFYFTEAADSYAGAFGDYSAMGVVAMAAYAEQFYPQGPQPLSSRDSAQPSVAEAAKQSVPGTGYGESQYSPSRAVSFDPEPAPLRKVFLKYEWRETLCAKRILPSCQSREGHPPNRLWPEQDDFAPPPPTRPMR